jgi:hypothetical protein
MQETVRHQAMEVGFKKSESFDDLKTCKLMLLNLDILNSILNIIKNHKRNTLSLFCHTLGNNEMYLSQVMNFIPDIVTKHWREDYIDVADLNKTSLSYEMIENILFKKDIEDYNFLPFNKYKVLNINYKVQALCLDSLVIKKTLNKIPHKMEAAVFLKIMMVEMRLATN